jgi:hypothetical protein
MVVVLNKPEVRPVTVVILCHCCHSLSLLSFFVSGIVVFYVCFPLSLPY